MDLVLVHLFLKNHILFDVASRLMDITLQVRKSISVADTCCCCCIHNNNYDFLF